MRPAGAVRNGFLKHRFSAFEGCYLRDWQQAEAEFFRSAANICQLYSLELPEVDGLNFPANMVSAHDELSAALKEKKGFSCYIMQDEKHVATLATAKPFETGFTLYYIPVRSFQRLDERPELSLLNQALTLVCAYLYQITKVDYYRDYCYVHSNYDSIEEWLNEVNGDDEYFDVQMGEMQEMKSFGDSFLPRLKKPFCLKELERVVKAYRKNACYDAACYEVFEEFAKFMKDYPKRSVFEGVPQDLYGRDGDGCIYLDQYLSFYWGGSDELNEVFFDMVNNELQESGEQVSPVALQWFDMPQEQELHHFDYEPRLFALILELNYILYKHDHAKKHHP